jgi:toxin ParE1/3/4
MARVVWLEEAVDQLDRIVTCVSAFDPRAADRLSTRLVAGAAALTDFPNRGRPASGGKRELPTVPPYIIRYRVEGEIVLVLGIRHGARRPVD